MKLAKGNLIADRYSILASEREGASSYLAEDKTNHLGNLQVLVNLRVLNRGDYNSALLFKRVRKVRSIKSDYVLKVFDLVKSAELLAVTCERQSGAKLSSVMKERVLTSAQINYIIAQVAKALGAIHEAGLVHGHLNEEYIYVDDLLWCKIDPIVPDKMEKLSAEKDFADLESLGERLYINANSQTTLLTPDGYFVVHFMVIAWLVTFLTFIALSKDIGDTLLDLTHLIDANWLNSIF